jgi:hypothetical protein
MGFGFGTQPNVDGHITKFGIELIQWREFTTNND